MATSQDIKSFIAQWLQLGKSVEQLDGSFCFKPEKIHGYQGYSQEFEDWWQEFERQAHKWALSGTKEPLDALYGDNWEITDCARCDMPIPILVAGLNDVDCPCSDLPHWPNLELPHPHTPDESKSRLGMIRDRLNF